MFNPTARLSINFYKTLLLRTPGFTFRVRVSSSLHCNNTIRRLGLFRVANFSSQNMSVKTFSATRNTSHLLRGATLLSPLHKGNIFLQFYSTNKVGTSAQSNTNALSDQCFDEFRDGINTNMELMFETYKHFKNEIDSQHIFKELWKQEMPKNAKFEDSKLYREVGRNVTRSVKDIGERIAIIKSSLRRIYVWSLTVDSETKDTKASRKVSDYMTGIKEKFTKPYEDTKSWILTADNDDSMRAPISILHMNFESLIAQLNKLADLLINKGRK